MASVQGSLISNKTKNFVKIINKARQQDKVLKDKEKIMHRNSRIGETPSFLTDADSTTDTNLKGLNDLSQ